MIHRRTLWSSFLMVFPAIAALGQDGQVAQRSDRDGIVIEFSAMPIGAPVNPAAEIHENDDLRLRLKVYDATTRNPLTGVRLSAWIDPENSGGGAGSCSQRAANYLEGGLFGQALFDLNSFLVLSLNSDASISVYDPRFVTGKHRLVARIALLSAGEDWVLSPDESLLFVSMPEAGHVAVIDTLTWRVVGNIATGPRPGRTLLQPEGDTIWVAGADALAAISIGKLDVVERFHFPSGIRDFTASADGRRIFVAATDSPTVSVIDTAMLATVREIHGAGSPVSMDYSPQSQLAYVVDGANGRILALSESESEPVAEIPVDPGVSFLRFAPGGRYGFALNSGRDRVYIIDASTNRVVQNFKIDKAPERVSFSARFAYIQRSDSGIVAMVPLDGIGDPSKLVPVTDLAAGGFPIVSAAHSTQADRIVPVPSGDSVLLANVRDRSIYFYDEKAILTTGVLSEARMPKAALTLDAAIRERRVPGTYETVFRARAAGAYSVAVYVDNPRLVRCFDLAISPKSPGPATDPGRVTIEPADFHPEVPVGKGFAVRFRVRDSAGRLKTGVPDIKVQIAAAGGNWYVRQPAAPSADGIYEAGFRLPEAGVYYVTLESRSLGIAYHESFRMVVRAV